MPQLWRPNLPKALTKDYGKFIGDPPQGGVGLDNLRRAIQDFVSDVDELERSEIKGRLCQSPAGEVILGDVVQYVPESFGQLQPLPCPEEYPEEIGIIHSHRNEDNRLSFFDINNYGTNPDYKKHRVACITNARVHETRCYRLNPESDFLSRFSEYWGKYHNENEAVKAFLEDAMYDWILEVKTL